LWDGDISQTISSRRTMRHMRFTALFLVIVLSLAAVAQTKQSQLGRGDEWLSWHPERRSGYVYGYVDGYLGGTLSSCHLTDEGYRAFRP
jgi:hypothetical protein